MTDWLIDWHWPLTSTYYFNFQSQRTYGSDPDAHKNSSSKASRFKRQEWKQTHGQTDGRTDGRTDRRTLPITNAVGKDDTALMYMTFTKYALRLSRADLRILTGLLTGRADLNRHLTLMQIRTDAVCPWCQEDEETVLYLLGERSALSAKRANILGSPYLSLLVVFVCI